MDGDTKKKLFNRGLSLPEPAVQIPEVATPAEVSPMVIYILGGKLPKQPEVKRIPSRATQHPTLKRSLTKR